MRKLVKGPSVIAACVLLSGCPEVVKVEGKVTAHTGAFFMSKQVRVGDAPPAFLPVNLEGQASVTLRDGSCQRTYRQTFVMPQSLSCDDDDNDDNDDDNKNNDNDSSDTRNEQPGNEQPPGEQPASTPEQSAVQSNQASTSRGQQPPGGSAGSGVQPPVVMGTPGVNYWTAASDLATVLGGLIVANEIRKEIRDDETPLSR